MDDLPLIHQALVSVLIFHITQLLGIFYLQQILGLVMFKPPKGDTCQPLSMDLDFIQKRLLDCCPFPTGNGRFAATCVILMGVIPWLGVVSGEVASCRRKHGRILQNSWGLGDRKSVSKWIFLDWVQDETQKTHQKDIQHRMNHPTSSNRIQSIYIHLGMGQKPTVLFP